MYLSKSPRSDILLLAKNGRAVIRCAFHISSSWFKIPVPRKVSLLRLTMVPRARSATDSQVLSLGIPAPEVRGTDTSHLSSTLSGGLFYARVYLKIVPLIDMDQNSRPTGFFSSGPALHCPPSRADYPSLNTPLPLPTSHHISLIFGCRHAPTYFPLLRSYCSTMSLPPFLQSDARCFRRQTPRKQGTPEACECFRFQTGVVASGSSVLSPSP